MKDILGWTDDGTQMGLRLLPVGGLDGTGRPLLPGIDPASVIALEPCPADPDDALAVCKPFGAGQIAVLGYLSRLEAAQAAATHAKHDRLTIRHGKAALVLHADGRVRIEGEDTEVAAHGRLALKGAYIELN